MRGPYVRHIEIGEMPFFWEEWESQWRALLSHMPRLKKLVVTDRDELHPSSDEYAALVRAVAALCPLLDVLVFPGYISRPWKQGVERSSRDDMFVLADAVWKLQGSLKQLQLNVGSSLNDVASANDHVNALVSRFPTIEAITSSRTKGLECFSLVTLFYEVWTVDLATWTRFCETCTELTEFNFVYVPFATAFFEIFGRTVKPRLTKIELSATLCCDWQQYLRELSADDRATIETRGYGRSAANVQSLCRGCPNLQCLEIAWGGNPPHHEDPEVFGDNFVEELVAQCPQLTRLACCPTERNFFNTSSADSLKTFTDRSMVALSRLLHLETVVLSGVDVSGKGLFQLAVLHAVATSYHRKYTIRPCQPAFTVVEEFLGLLVQHVGQLPRAVSLTVLGNRGFNTHNDHLELSLLMSRAKAKHPGIELKCLTIGSSSDELGELVRVQEFQFASSSSVARDWDHPSDLPGITDRVLFDGIVKREFDFYTCPENFHYGPYTFRRTDVHRPGRRFEPFRAVPLPDEDEDL